jgi:hypothetical protein
MYFISHFIIHFILLNVTYICLYLFLWYSFMFYFNIVSVYSTVLFEPQLLHRFLCYDTLWQFCFIIKTLQLVISFCLQVCAVVCAPDKQKQLLWLLQVILRTVKRASQEGQLFAYVPSFYIDCLIEICSVPCTHMHPMSILENLGGSMLSLYIYVFLYVYLCAHMQLWLGMCEQVNILGWDM